MPVARVWRAATPPVRPKKHCFSFHMPKIHCNLPKLVHTCSYEWVLKKKHNFCFKTQPVRQRRLRCDRPVSMRRARVALLRRARVVHPVRSTVLASMPSSLPSRRPRSPLLPPR